MLVHEYVRSIFRHKPNLIFTYQIEIGSLYRLTSGLRLTALIWLDIALTLVLYNGQRSVNPL